MSYSPREAARTYVHNLGIAGPKSWAWMVTYDAGYDAGVIEASKSQVDQIITLEHEVAELKAEGRRILFRPSEPGPRMSRDPNGGWSKW